MFALELWERKASPKPSQPAQVHGERAKIFASWGSKFSFGNERPSDYNTASFVVTDICYEYATCLIWLDLSFGMRAKCAVLNKNQSRPFALNLGKRLPHEHLHSAYSCIPSPAERRWIVAFRNILFIWLWRRRRWRRGQSATPAGFYAGVEPNHCFCNGRRRGNYFRERNCIERIFLPGFRSNYRSAQWSYCHTSEFYIVPRQFSSGHALSGCGIVRGYGDRHLYRRRLWVAALRAFVSDHSTGRRWQIYLHPHQVRSNGRCDRILPMGEFALGRLSHTHVALFCDRPFFQLRLCYGLRESHQNRHNCRSGSLWN